MKRREFLALSCLVGLPSLDAVSDIAQGCPQSKRDFYELRQYKIKTQAQKDLFDTFMAQAAIPALNRIGISPVGVFRSQEVISPIYVLLRHRSPESFTLATQKLLADQEYLSKGASFLNAPSSSPAYDRVESSVMVAFSGMPHLETPIKVKDRVFQLRTYESPSVKTGQKKIEMFNQGELAIFRRTGLNPVFFGETLVGPKIPNLTYMLVFNNMPEQKANWKRFISDPEWKKLSAIPAYANKKIISGITNLNLIPADYSQI